MQEPILNVDREQLSKEVYYAHTHTHIHELSSNTEYRMSVYCPPHFSAEVNANIGGSCNSVQNLMAVAARIPTHTLYCR